MSDTNLDDLEYREWMEINMYKYMGSTILMFCPNIKYTCNNIELFKVFLGYWICNEYSRSEEKYNKRIFKPMKI